MIEDFEPHIDPDVDVSPCPKAVSSDGSVEGWQEWLRRGEASPGHVDIPKRMSTEEPGAAIDRIRAEVAASIDSSKSRTIRPTTIRPNWSSRWAQAGAPLVGVGAVLVLHIPGGRRNLDTGEYLFALSVVFVGLLLVTASQIARCRVIIGPTELRAVGVFRTRRAPVKDIAAIATLTLSNVNPYSPSMRTREGFLLDHDERVVMQLRASTWAPTHFADIADALDVDQVAPDETVAHSHVPRIWPGTGNRLDANPTAWGIAIAAIITVPIVVVAVVASA